MKRDEYIRSFEKFADAVEGVLECHIVRQEQSLDVLLAAAFGKPHAKAISDAVEQWLRRRDELQPLCLACDAELDKEMPHGFLITMPYANFKVSAMVTGICAECAKHDDEYLVGVAAQRLRQVWPSIGIMPPGDGGIQ